MKLENDIGVWEPNELVYSASDLPTYSYLVIEGQAQIVSPSGLRLSSIGYNELFGEASFILGKNRTVTAIAGENGLTARLIKSDHLIAKLKQDIFLSALVRKLEARLSNSNEKSEVLANGMKPDDAKPAAVKSIFCSPIPQEIVLSGNCFLKCSDLVDLPKSASNTTTFSLPAKSSKA